MDFFPHYKKHRKKSNDMSSNLTARPFDQIKLMTVKQKGKSGTVAQANV